MGILGGFGEVGLSALVWSFLGTHSSILFVVSGSMAFGGQFWEQ